MADFRNTFFTSPPISIPHRYSFALLYGASNAKPKKWKFEIKTEEYLILHAAFHEFRNTDEILNNASHGASNFSKLPLRSLSDNKIRAAVFV